MKKIIFILFAILSAGHIRAQDSNIRIALNDALGIQILANWPGYTGSWARGYQIMNQAATTDLFGIGAHGVASNGVSDITYGWIGKNYDQVYMSFKPNGNIGIGTITPQDNLDLRGTDAGISLSGTIRTRLNLSTTSQQGWQVEVGNAVGSGNQAPGDLGFTEAGVSGGRLVLKKGGNVLIGKTSQTNPVYKLDVNGSVRADEIKVNTTGADFVFAEDYPLRSLEETENFIKANKHLPDIASAKEMSKDGISLGEMNAKLLQKIEELTLYIIAQSKRSDKQDQIIEAQQKEINQLKSKL